MISEKQQLIYNIYLKYFRNGKPYKPRKNFENITNDQLLYLNKLELFFDYFKEININYYFEAPYKVLDKNGVFDLKFYLTQKAKKCYTSYINEKRINKEISYDDIKKDLSFIYNFCKEHNITIFDYINYKYDDSPYFAFFQHLKNNNVNIFTLFGFTEFENNIYNTSSEYKDYMFNNLDEIISANRIKFYSSKYKELIKKSLNILNEKIK